MSTKQERVEHANALIKVIASHGRRFFYNERDDRTARLEMDGRGRVWFVDDYKGARIYTHKTGFTSRWRGFSHGGTLRSLVEQMSDYIASGVPLSRWVIAPQRLSEDSNIWGYSKESAEAVREAAFSLPIIELEKQAA